MLYDPPKAVWTWPIKFAMAEVVIFAVCKSNWFCANVLLYFKLKYFSLKFYGNHSWTFFFPQKNTSSAPHLCTLAGPSSGWGVSGRMCASHIVYLLFPPYQKSLYKFYNDSRWFSDGSCVFSNWLQASIIVSDVFIFIAVHTAFTTFSKFSFSCYGMSWISTSLRHILHSFF